MRNGRAKAIPETLNNWEEEGNEDEEDKIKEGRGFYACYLLTSLCPRFKGHTYIGFTVNPRRRIRQHNGEIRSGAFKTKKRRPWEMVFCIYGFPTNVSALQFEWAWQHPTESVAVRQAAATFKSFSGVANKIKLAYTMLCLPSWQSLDITVNYFSTKYAKLSSACPSLPEHMKVQVCPIEELPSYSRTAKNLFECGDAEHGFNDQVSDKSSGRISGAVRESLIELEGHSIHKSPCCNGGEESLSEEGVGSNGGNGYEGFSEVGCTDGTIKEREANTAVPDNLQSINGTYENFGWFKELQHLKDISADYSPVLKVDNAQPFVSINSAVRRAFSKEVNCKGDASNLNMNSYVRTCELNSPNEKSLSSKAYKDQPSLNSYSALQQIEVIDLLSPSPESRLMSSRKKRRVLTVSPEIIDLT